MVKRYETSQYSEVFGPLSSQAAIKHSSCRTHGRVKKPCETTLPKPNAKKEIGGEPFRNTVVCLGVNLLGSTPLTKCSQNAFRSKDKYRTEGISVQKNSTTNFQTLK
jgi:hypothetical protein